MKTTSILFAALMMISVVALADEPAAPKLVVVSQKESGLFKVIYENPKSSKVKMTIFNSEGNALYSESIKATDGFILPVNFKGLTPGEYSIEVADGTAKAVHKVSYVAPVKTQAVHVSKLSTEANKYLLSVANEGVINVRILDGANNLIHEQDLTVKGSLGLVYNLKSIDGNPTFVVTNSEGVSKTVKY